MVCCLSSNDLLHVLFILSISLIYSTHSNTATTTHMRHNNQANSFYGVAAAKKRRPIQINDSFFLILYIACCEPYTRYKHNLLYGKFENVTFLIMEEFESGRQRRMEEEMNLTNSRKWRMANENNSVTVASSVVD